MENIKHDLDAIHLAMNAYICAYNNGADSLSTSWNDLYDRKMELLREIA